MAPGASHIAAPSRSVGGGTKNPGFPRNPSLAPLPLFFTVCAPARQMDVRLLLCCVRRAKELGQPAKPPPLPSFPPLPPGVVPSVVPSVGLRDGGGGVGLRAKSGLCTSNGPFSSGSPLKTSFFPRGKLFWFWVGGVACGGEVPPPPSLPLVTSARRECGQERSAQASTPEVQATPNMEHRIYATTQTQSPVQRVTRR